jgi:hypothetical protein
MDNDIELLQQVMGHGGTQAFEIVPLALKKIIAEEQWRSRKDKHGKEFKSFEAFATHRLWQGLETTLQDLQAFCRKRKDVEKMVLEAMEPGRLDGGDRRSEQFQSDNVTLKRGNSALYTLKRLKRDRPDLFEDVLNGELSANAAAIEAGFRKKPTPFETVCKLLPKLTAVQKEDVIKRCQE